MLASSRASSRTTRTSHVTDFRALENHKVFFVLRTDNYCSIIIREYREKNPYFVL